MFGKINVLKIIIDHVNTFKGIGTRKFKFSEIMLFAVIPIALSCYVVGWKKFYFKPDHVNILIASLSILAGFLFNLLAMIFGFMDKLKENAENDDIKLVLVKEIHINISFSILLSIFCIVFLLFCDVETVCLKVLFNVLALFFIISFLLAMLMVLKRIYIIMSKELA